MGKYFGTDGIRGKFGETLTEELVYAAGFAIGRYFGGDCVVGRDTRVSGEALEAALVRGLISAGVNVQLLGILPTPAVSLLTKSTFAACGVMISASHNPPEYNGIKVFGRNGIKLSEQQEDGIEYYMDNPSSPEKTAGHIYKFYGAAEQYIGRLTVGRVRLDGAKVWLDCGFGASGGIAAEVFRRLGARVVTLNDTFEGDKINTLCGALYIDRLKDIINVCGRRYVNGRGVNIEGLSGTALYFDGINTEYGSFGEVKTEYRFFDDKKQFVINDNSEENSKKHSCESVNDDSERKFMIDDDSEENSNKSGCESVNDDEKRSVIDDDSEENSKKSGCKLVNSDSEKESLIDDGSDEKSKKLSCKSVNDDGESAAFKKRDAEYISGEHLDAEYISNQGLRLHNGAGLEGLYSKSGGKRGAELGFAFDGDADRMAMVYGGRVLDGDSVLYSLSRVRHLKDDVVVGTVMNNIALEKKLAAEGKRLLRTKVGDKHVLDLMLRHDYTLGGEQSGHYIFYPDCATGDGIMAALKMTAAYLSGDVYRLDIVPQKTLSLFCARETLYDKRLTTLTEEAERRLSRILVRMSGTEPKIRIMAEDENAALVDEILDSYKELITDINAERQRTEGEP